MVWRVRGQGLKFESGLKGHVDNLEFLEDGGLGNIGIRFGQHLGCANDAFGPRKVTF